MRATLVAKGHDRQPVTFRFRLRAHNDSPIQHKEAVSSFLRRLFRCPDAAEDFRVGQRVQRPLALRRCKGPVCQQAAVQRAICPEDIVPEPLRQLGQQWRAREQDLPGHLIGIGQRDTVCSKNRRDRGFSAAAAARNAQRDHSLITRNAAARIRRL